SGFVDAAILEPVRPLLVLRIFALAGVIGGEWPGARTAAGAEPAARAAGLPREERQVHRLLLGPAGVFDFRNLAGAGVAVDLLQIVGGLDLALADLVDNVADLDAGPLGRTVGNDARDFRPG